MFKPTSAKVNFPDLEKKILDYWYSKGVVSKYLSKNSREEKRYSFTDGPITANNPMGVHHAWGRTYKDLWQRFYNMRGFRQRFQNGFDCQGLWVEVEVEKELGIRNKKDIENLIEGDKLASIARFVRLCKERVQKFSQIQTEQSIRLGYFMNWDNSYFTMSDENNYMIWHFLKTCYLKGWIYKGRDSVPWCPRCETAISQHEMLTEDYKELTHESVFFKLPVNGADFSLLAWTTTPWTIPANVALAVNPNFIYRKWKNKKTREKIVLVREDQLPKRDDYDEYIKDKRFIDEVFKGGDWEKISDYSGKELVGLHYNGPFDNLELVKRAKEENTKMFHSVVAAEDLVTATKGTGILHVASGAGQEDFQLAKEKDIPILNVIGDNANYLGGMGEFTGKNAKKHPELVIDHLKKYKNGKFILRTMQFTHRYPACWRCKTELVWRVEDEWYIAMDKKSSKQKEKENNRTLREMMVEVAKKIRWIPKFGLDRELDWLRNMHDWLISKKNRYWGLALPIYECKNCSCFEIIGSKEELEKRAVAGWDVFEGHTPHKPWIDEVKINCRKCGRKIRRIDDVGNPWLDAGIVTFSTLIDPKTRKLSYTSDKKYWRNWFPADFITESFPGQFKNWFYSLIAMSTVLEQRPPFKTVLGFATLLGEDGRPMHKSWGNAIEFNEGADRIGVDVMRWMYVIQNPSDNLLFGFKKADEVRRKFHIRLWNVYNFFVSYANIDKWSPKRISYKKVSHVLDKWILERLSQLIFEVTRHLNNYDAFLASFKIEQFVDDLSTWYVRRIRDRIGPTASNGLDKNIAYTTLHTTLTILSRILAPFIPFLSEEIYRNLTEEDSVHLSSWPKVSKKYSPDKKLFEKMQLIRKICEAGHKIRKEKGIKVRQPLGRLTIKNLDIKIENEFIDLIKDELNIKEVETIKGEGELSISLDTKISLKLKQEGEARDLIRQIQLKRKEMKCGLADEIRVFLPGWSEQLLDFIKKETLAKEVRKGKKLEIERL